jgi:hypothetical protein
MFELIFVLFCYIILFFLFLYFAFSNFSTKVKAPFYLLFVLLFTYITYVSSIFWSKKNEDSQLFYIFQRFFFIYGEYILIILGLFIVCIVLYKIFMGLLVFTLTQSMWAIILIILVLALVQNVFYKTEDDGPLVTLIKDVIFYIPCLITDSIDFLKKDYANTPSTTFVVFILIIICSIIFFLSSINLDGGHLLMSGPQNLNTITVFSTEQLLALDNKPTDEWKTDVSYNEIDLELPPDKPKIYPSDKLTKEIVDKSIENFSNFNRFNKFNGFEGFTGLVQQDTNPQFKFGLGMSKDISTNNFDIKALYDEQSNHVQKYLSKIDSGFKSFKDLFKSRYNYTPYTYNYGLSFWVYINTFHFKKFSPKPQKILTFGEKFNLLYDTLRNELIISLQGDEVYRSKGILFQRWNHIVVNSEDSKIDLFINNNLVGTYKYSNITPRIQDRIQDGIQDDIQDGIQDGIQDDIQDGIQYGIQDGIEHRNQVGNVSVVSLYDSLNVGSRDNINFGSICNFRYYNNILDLSKIKSIYTKYNKKNPPL